MHGFGGFGEIDDGAEVNVSGARENTVEITTMELRKTEENCRRIKELLNRDYSNNLRELGGLPELKPDEVERAREAVAYFSGGSRPEWM